jgi:hypothetical protein
MDVAEPFADHATAARLSLAIHTVRSATSRSCARMSLWAIMPVSSKSEMVMAPCRLSLVTNWRATRTGKRWRQTIGDASGLSASNQTPPIPV